MTTPGEKRESGGAGRHSFDVGAAPPSSTKDSSPATGMIARPPKNATKSTIGTRASGFNITFGGNAGPNALPSGVSQADMRQAMLRDKSGTQGMGQSFASALALVKGTPGDDDDEIPEEGGLTLGDAFLVLFCTAFGAGTAFQGWYPKLAGYLGYPICIVLVATTSALASNAIFNCARWSGATSFAELCLYLPPWTRKVTPWASIIWNFTVMANYEAFLYSFINLQIMTKWDSHYCDGTIVVGRCDTGDGSPAPAEYGVLLYLFVAFLVFVVTLPSNFGGSAMKTITAFNACVTWVVIIFAVIKGLHTYSILADGFPVPAPGETETYVAFRPEGIPRVLVLLASAMFTVVQTPRINCELKEEVRERGAVVLPWGLAALQGSVFFFVGWSGYFALGNGIPDDGDTFKAYFKLHNDWMVFILQGGISLLMYLSCPIFSVVGKGEIWGQISARDAEGNTVPFENAPFGMRLLYNVVTVGICMAAPMLAGRENYMKYFTVCAGTATNWINMILPGIVIFWVQVGPARTQGKPWVKNAFIGTWILCLATLCFGTALISIGQGILSFFQ